MAAPKIASADFITSAKEPKGYPTEGLPEAAFVGRSNVGKSSTINCLLNRRNLVKTSSTPGKTRLINFFRINDAFVFADLPGYGYAKVPESMRRSWQPMVETYFKKRKELRVVVVLVDARRMPSEQDLMLLEYLDFHKIPWIVALTKADKLKRSELAKLKSSMHSRFEMEPGEFVVFSARTGLGKDDLWRRIRDRLET